MSDPVPRVWPGDGDDFLRQYREQLGAGDDETLAACIARVLKERDDARAALCLFADEVAGLNGEIQPLARHLERFADLVASEAGDCDCDCDCDCDFAERAATLCGTTGRGGGR